MEYGQKQTTIQEGLTFSPRFQNGISQSIRWEDLLQENKGKKTKTLMIRPI
jgi:hypothetical protein